MSRLTERSLLVSLAISQWAARKLDKKETAAIAAKHGTAAEVARVNKSLMAFAKPLDDIYKATGELRNWSYAQTLPWAVDGSRILMVENYMAYCAGIRQRLDKREQLVDVFLSAYPQLCEDAKIQLNGMWNARDYPPPHTMKHRFRAEVVFLPVPDAGDFRVSMSDDDADLMRKQITEQVQRAEGMATRDCWDRLYKVVSKAAEKLADPKGIFRDSLVENARELCELLPRLNVMDDPNLEAMRHSVEKALCVHDADDLRKSSIVRNETAAKLQSIMGTMGAFYAPSTP